MSNNNTTLFQYCPKLVIFNPDFSQVLLCERQGEADFDKTYSFAGGKVENNDGDIWLGMKREKNEELGKNCQIRLFKNFCEYAYYIKKDGTHMILPHHLCIFENGEIELSDEYSGYKWIDINNINNSELSMIPTVVPTIHTMKKFANKNTLGLSESMIL